MNKYWLSWYHDVDGSEFELHSPWWVSGWRVSDMSAAIVAAVKAESVEDAWEIIYNSYDERPDSLEERFCDELTVSPFSGRFPRTDWMVWDE